MENNKVIGYVYETYDYEQFKQMNGNRKPDHAETIAKSIKENGLIFNPIIVSNDMAVIDGGNRLEAFKQTKSPVRFIVSEKADAKDCIILNSTQKRWGMKEYIGFYAKNGECDYQLLKKMLDEFESTINSNVIMAICSGNIQFVSQKAIKNGNFKFHDYELARKKLEYLKMFDFSKINRGKKDCLVFVIATLYELKEIDNTKLKSQFDHYGHLIEPVVDIETALDELEKLYNYKVPKRSYVFLKSVYKQEAMQRNFKTQFTKKERK